MNYCVYFQSVEEDTHVVHHSSLSTTGHKTRHSSGQGQGQSKSRGQSHGPSGSQSQTSTQGKNSSGQSQQGSQSKGADSKTSQSASGTKNSDSKSSQSQAAKAKPHGKTGLSHSNHPKGPNPAGKAPKDTSLTEKHALDKKSDLQPKAKADAPSKGDVAKAVTSAEPSSPKK